MKKQLFLITVPKTDAMGLLPELLTSSSTFNGHPSGIVVLMACISRPIQNLEKTWNHDDYKRVKKCKPNILQTSNHHQSMGYYAFFGNKGSYETLNDSSVRQYKNKKNSCSAKQLLIDQDASRYEKLCANEVARSVNDLCKIMPNIRSVISPVIETSFNLQRLESKSLNLKQTSAITEGCWQTSICIDAETKEFHTEHVCTYTLISIPDQNIKKNIPNPIEYNFLFNLTTKQSINVPLKAGV
jgi:hypothetical protein